VTAQLPDQQEFEPGCIAGQIFLLINWLKFLLINCAVTPDALQGRKLPAILGCVWAAAAAAAGGSALAIDGCSNHLRLAPG
jgi:hypothetical protein